VSKVFFEALHPGRDIIVVLDIVRVQIPVGSSYIMAVEKLFTQSDDPPLIMCELYTVLPLSRSDETLELRLDF